MRYAISEGPEPEYEKVVSGYETFHHAQPFRCEWGGVLPELTLAYETWGTLSPGRDNVVLLHTGLSASSHAHSQPHNPHPGWWEDFIGPELALDTDDYYVICTNLLGGCYGSTGPSSANPDTGQPYATDFPIITVRDMTRAQILLLDHLGIDRLHASVGASLGGMQSLMLAAIAPERVGRLVSISSAACSHPQSIAMRFVQRQAVMADPDWRDGRYYGESFPHRGLRVAREMGTLTYRSGPEWEERFGRKRIKDEVPRLDEDFQVESYLAYQGDKFCLQYDPNSYLYISKAMDLFDMAEGEGEGHEPTEPPIPEARIANIGCPSLVIGVTSDLLFPVWQQRELARLLEDAGGRVTYLELDAPFGHDTFLIERDRVGGAVRDHLMI
jgi:homoserine O-acetyltransferase